MKNLLLLLAMLIFSSTVFSQLYVQPNGGTDSYVYVKDEVLFVEDDVNLEVNTNVATTKASIYLREGSQLIQGSGATLNSGDGYISIYQTIDETSNYHYNFWHSPVGNQNLAGTGNVNAGVSRLYDINDVTDSDIVSTTTGSNGNSTTDPITVSTRWIYTRTSSPANEEEGNYHHIGPNDNIQAGQGFTMKGVSNGAISQSQEYDFRGRPNNGTINVSINTGLRQWTLSGNPYPSAMDLKLFYADNTANGLTEIRFWDEPKDEEFSHQYSEKSGGYGTWIPGPDNTEDNPGVYTAPSFKNYTANGGINNGSPTTGTGPNVDRRYSPVGQGFVLDTDGSASTITLKNEYRVFKKIGEVSEIRIQENENDPAERNSSYSDGFVVVTPQIRINMVFNDVYARQLLLLFHDESTDGYDVGLDAHHPMDSGGAEAYYLIEENEEMEPFVIQTRPYADYKQIPIGFSLDAQTKITINTIDIQNFERDTYFWDSVNDTYKKLSIHPSEFIDTGILLPAGVYEDRFFIVFKERRQLLEESEGTKAIDIAKASVDFFQNNPYQQMEVSNPEGYDIKSAAVYDMTGKLVATKHNVGTVSNFNIPTSNLADGVYLVKLTTIENINIDFKTIIQNN